MFSRIRKHFTYANVALTLALVLAMTGGAYAASKYLITSTKQISPKVLKALAGKPGPAGPAGRTGSAGPAGSAGASGAKGETGATGKDGAPGEKGLPGEKGANGTNGFNGANGTSVTSRAVLTSEAACNKEGGSEFTAAANSKTLACDGKEGSPWTAGGTLPVGSSETGQWSFTVTKREDNAEVATASISFAIPLAKALGGANSHFIGPEEGEGEPKAKLPAGCSGNFQAPKAKSGNLCVFTQRVVDLTTFSLLPELNMDILDAETGGEEAGKSGAYLYKVGLSYAVNANDVIVGSGDWVVTG